MRTLSQGILTGVRLRARVPSGRRFRPWGLNAARGGSRGFTLIEILIIIAVIGVLAAIGLFLYSDFAYQAQVARAAADIAILESEVTTFAAINLRLPNDLSEIGRAGYRDPWGYPYQYLNFEVSGQAQARKDRALHPINTEYDLYSVGRDGASQPPITAHASQDDVIRANDGQYVGLAANY